MLAVDLFFQYPPIPHKTPGLAKKKLKKTKKLKIPKLKN